ncbi:unnamed protein product, partial [Laminaria digitata]
LKTGVTQRIHLEWCIVPVTAACFWLTVELVVSVVSLRRAMVREQRLQRVAIRRIRRQHSRQITTSSISSSEASGTGAGGGGGGGGSHLGFPRLHGESLSLLQRAQRQERLWPTSGRRGWARGEIPPNAVAAAAAGAAAAAAAAAAARADGTASGTALTAAALSAAAAAAAAAAAEAGGDAGGDAAGADTASSDARTSTSANLVLSSPSMSADTGDSQRDEGEGEGGGCGSTADSADFVGASGSAAAATTAAAAAAVAVVPGRVPSRKPLRRQESDAGRRPVQKRSDVLARAVRVSCLLQWWVRLWLAMAVFSITLSAFTVLMSLRIFGVSAASLSTGAIASPGLVALSLLALHSFAVLDGERGSGGGATNRQGAARSRLGLSRRPLILLSLLCVSLVVAKIDSAERDQQGKILSAVARLAEGIPWWCAFSPLWVVVALIESVYLIALWENHAGESMASSLRGGAGGSPGCLAGWRDSCECPAWGGVGDGKRRARATATDRRDRYDSRAGRRHRAAVSYSNAVRRRVELTPNQRAAAASLVGGILCLTLSMLAVTLRAEPVVSWGVPMTMLTAAVGMALVGAGLGQLAAAFCGTMRGPLPLAATPLPVFFCERQGGWVAGPPDPPTVSIFLLGEVTLRQE